MARAGTLSYFRWAFAVTAVGLLLTILLGWSTTGTISGTIGFFIVGLILAVLEISLSFDNAIVNANRLETMTEIWRKRFLTWGIIIAVFGMRIIFPLAVVSIAAKINPIAALELALVRPAAYAEIMHDAHLSIAAFGGAFLMMVGLHYFLDAGKEIHWLHHLEETLSRWAVLDGVQYALVLALVLGFSMLHQGEEQATFLFSALFGLVTYAGVKVLGQVLDRADQAADMTRAGGLGAFLYLEVLDASFSFDGVIGAFALTQNLLLIAIGLGIGAMYVRSMTIMLVERQTLAEFRYLEHGAFWSILALSVVMFVQTLVHVPEIITGLAGAGLIGLAFLSSIRHNRRAPA